MMRNMFEALCVKDVLKVMGTMLIAIGALLIIRYGVYPLVKSISYKLFYQDMVRSTIVEMVNPGSLK